ncbi:serine/threonine protein kinase [Candidatus Micrarchaeota archaeon]|nr:serine/threonine protein kinase [Candidatus Micrarchaeota archaeon]
MKKFQLRSIVGARRQKEDPAQVMGRFHKGAPLDEFSGRVIADRYNITERIGIGGTSNVYLALDNDTGEHVAVKVSHDQEKNRFISAETGVLKQVKHPNVVEIREEGTVDGRYFVVLEHLEIDLRKLLCRREIEWGELQLILTQVCNGLGAIHRAGLIHSDVKPQNIMITVRDGKEVAKLVDFGASIWTCDGPTYSTVAGTPQYMSPEQVSGKVDYRTDIYALGIVMYEAMCGKVPFEGKSPLETAVKHMDEKPELPSRIRPGVLPEELEAIAMRALQKDPGDRFQTIGEMGMAISRCMKGFVAAWEEEITRTTLELGQIAKTIFERKHPAHRTTELELPLN